ncbi:hypothetical protein ORJ04_22500 [Rheinheimera baltica]|uniref:Uncharacterized protein n=1 Tax=Rheinheimera baltica TaxID=67576 RepID=A0ABT9I6Y7_9GAMM|nr:hypothetical protein [Rheinheimera baltica]MDP5138721.1 hypothetical protein [Rheinheimera baltica]MDP5149780.1 hypothetical protein [Rheinheimera baltica]
MPITDATILQIENSSLFDANWYRTEYPDIDVLGIAPVQHYLQIGWLMGRNPSLRFNTKVYLSTYPDVAERNINPLLHYLTEGISKGYKPQRIQDNPLAQFTIFSGSQIEYVKRMLETEFLTGQPDVHEQLKRTQRLLDHFLVVVKDSTSTFK